jgi:hypothetical protein
MVFGKECCAQVPMYAEDDVGAQLIYKTPNNEQPVPLKAEWGSLFNVKFPSSDGGYVEWGNNSKFLNSLKEHEKNNEKILGSEDRISKEDT